MPWMQLAQCKDNYLDFTAENMSAKYIEKVKEVCAECPVRRECLDHANKYKESVGIWGGQTVQERQNIRPKPRNTIQLDPEELAQDFKEMTLKAVAEKHDVSEQTIYRHIREYPWIRPKKGKKR